MENKYITLENLYAFFESSNNDFRFNSQECGSEIVVKANGSLLFESKDNNTEGLLPVVLQSCHLGKNINQSSISREVLDNALPSFANRPILGFIHKVDDQYEFYSHNMHEDEDGEIVYDEVPVGVIPESFDGKVEYDEEKDKDYVVVKGYIYEEYSKAADILRREKECPVSVELSIRELSYNARDKELVIENFFFSGVTILGKNEDGEEVRPGMSGANIKIDDRDSKKDDALIKKENQLFESIDKLTQMLSMFQIDFNNSEEGGKCKLKFDELLAKYNVTIEEIDFNYSEMSEEELESAFAEKFEEVVDDQTYKYSKITELENGDSLVAFEISHEDIRSALYNLIAQFDEEDDTYYYIKAVYDSYFIMSDWSGSVNYKQEYTKDGDNVALSGERIAVYEQYLTESELAYIEEMRGNYEELVKVKQSVEKEEKDQILNSECYSILKDSEEFKKLREEAEKYSVQDISDKADILYAKERKRLDANKQAADTTKKIRFSNDKEDIDEPYGNLFK